MSPGRYRLGLLAAVGLHLIVLAFFALEIIPQDYKREGYRFWFHQGGDGHGYHALALDLAYGDFEANKYPLGFPVLMLPFVWLIQPPTYERLVEPIALFWAVVMFPLGQLLLAHLALKLSGRRRVALLSVWLWTALPLLTYGVLRLIWNAAMAEIVAVHMPWAQMLSDGAATFFTLLALWLFLQARPRDYPPLWVALLGVTLGLLVLIRLSAVVTPISIGLWLLWERRWRVLISVTALALLIFAPQLLYNAAFFGHPLTTGYTALDALPPEGLFHLSYGLDAFGKIWARLGVATLLLLALGVAALGIALREVAGRDQAGAWLLAWWIGAYIACYSLYYYSWTGGLLRFLLPIYPALAFVAALTLERIAQARLTTHHATTVHRH